MEAQFSFVGYKMRTNGYVIKPILLSLTLVNDWFANVCDLNLSWFAEAVSSIQRARIGDMKPSLPALKRKVGHQTYSSCEPAERDDLDERIRKWRRRDSASSSGRDTVSRLNRMRIDGEDARSVVSNIV